MGGIVMKFYRDLFNFETLASVQPTFITIGTFDGVHKGHQQLITKVVKEAKKNQGFSIAITFDPLPKMFFSNKPIRLTSPQMRAERISSLGIDILIEYTFDEYFSKRSASDFMEKILLGCNPRKIWIGKDFRFGYKGTGDASLLKQAGLQNGFETEVVNFVHLKGERISSTRVRRAIACGDMGLAAELMGSDHAVGGWMKQTKKGHDHLMSTEEVILPPTGFYDVNIRSRQQHVYSGPIGFDHDQKEIYFVPNARNLEIHQPVTVSFAECLSIRDFSKKELSFLYR